MVTVKGRFRGVKQNLKRFRVSWGRKIYDREWKIWKKEKKMKKSLKS